jgi:hypothetical protein
MTEPNPYEAPRETNEPRRRTRIPWLVIAIALPIAVYMAVAIFYLISEAVWYSGYRQSLPQLGRDTQSGVQQAP